jgi:hypothetical protein
LPIPTSSPQPAGLWLLASLPVLCVASYPGAVLVSFVFWAGAVALFCLAAYSMVLVRPQRAGGPEVSAGHHPALPALLGSAAVIFVAVVADRAGFWTALLCGLITGADTLLLWLFLPWVAADAQASQLSPAAADPFSRQAPRALLPRGGLGFLLLLGLLLLGLGGVWAWGEQRVPGPLPWLFALMISSLLVQLRERLVFLARSARDGNLVLADRAHQTWVAVACALIAVAAAMAALLPWRPSPPHPSQTPPGSAVVRLLPAFESMRAGASQLGSKAIASAERSAAALGAVPRHVLLLWLLLLLLFVALLLAWVLHRTRAGRWVLAAAAWMVDRLLRVWRRLCWAARRLLQRRRRGLGTQPLPGGVAQEPNPDPLFDIFTDPQALSRLSAREIVVRTYHLLLNFAEMLGHGRPPGQTPFEYAHRLSAIAPVAQGAIAAITWGYANAMYGAEDAGLPAATTVREVWQRISRALTASLTPEELSLRRQRYLAAVALELAHHPRH